MNDHQLNALRAEVNALLQQLQAMTSTWPHRKVRPRRWSVSSIACC